MNHAAAPSFELRSPMVPVTISVMIPVHNGGAMLAGAVRSALGQEPSPKKVIVVDDGSTDDPRGTLGELIDRVEFVSQARGGVSAARNTGSRLAQSEYIAYLDADDLWKPGKLEVITRCIVQADRPGVVMDDFYRLDVDGSVLPRNSELFPFFREYGVEGQVAGRPIRRLSQHEFLKVLVRGFPSYPSAMVVRSDLLDEAGGWDERFPRCQDFDLALRLAMLTSVVIIDDTLTVVRRHTGHGDFDRYLVTQLEGDHAVLQHHMDHLAEERELAPIVGRRLLGIAHNFRRLGRPCEARKACRQAMRLPGNAVRARAAWIRTFLR